MTTGLKEALRNIATTPKTEEELECGTRNLIGFAKCLLIMRQEIKENESDNTNPCFHEDAGRRFELDGSE